MLLLLPPLLCARSATVGIEAKPTLVGKAAAASQFGLLWFVMANGAFGMPDKAFIDGFCWVVGGVTVLSGLSYLDLKSIASKSKVKGDKEKL